MGRAVVLVERVPLDAHELADAIAAYVLARLSDDKRRRAGEPAFRSTPWTETVRRLRNLRADAQLDPDPSTSDRARPPAEFKHINKRRKRNQPGCPQ